MCLEVRARRAQGRQRAAAQRAVQRQPRPAAIAYRRYCQRARVLRGICNADITSITWVRAVGNTGDGT